MVEPNLSMGWAGSVAPAQVKRRLELEYIDAIRGKSLCSDERDVRIGSASTAPRLRTK